MASPGATAKALEGNLVANAVPQNARRVSTLGPDNADNIVIGQHFPPMEGEELQRLAGEGWIVDLRMDYLALPYHARKLALSVLVGN